MPSRIHEIAELDRAILRRASAQQTIGPRPCAGCGRTPLIGESIYLHEDGDVRCELCREPAGGQPVVPRVVRGPAFGDTMRGAA